MKFLIVLAIFLVAIAADGNVRLIGHQVHEDYPGKCYHKDTKHVWDVDEVYTPIGICEELVCQTDSVVRVTVCPYVGYPANCKSLGGDPTKGYPLCCSKYECTDADGKVTYRQVGE